MASLEGQYQQVTIITSKITQELMDRMTQTEQEVASVTDFTKNLSSSTS